MKVKRTFVTSMFLFSLIFTMAMGTALAQMESRPNWALTESDMSDYELYLEESETYEDPNSDAKLEAWYQIWVKPSGCIEDGSCNAVVGAVYAESNQAATNEDLQAIKNAFEQYSEFEDITSEVPYAALAFVYEQDYGYGASISGGLAIFNTKKHMVSVAEATVAQTSAPKASASTSLDNLKEILIASGQKAQAALQTIPGYEVMILLGIMGSVSAILIFKKLRK